MNCPTSAREFLNCFVILFEKNVQEYSLKSIILKNGNWFLRASHKCGAFLTQMNISVPAMCFSMMPLYKNYIQFQGIDLFLK